VNGKPIKRYKNHGYLTSKRLRNEHSIKKNDFFIFDDIIICDLSISNTVNAKKLDDDFLPNSIKNFIKDSLSEYSVPNENQFIDEWKSYDHISTPRFAFSDFNGDSKKDYAIILLSKNYKEILLVVFCQITCTPSPYIE
jgi:hypothetical protein